MTSDLPVWKHNRTLPQDFGKGIQAAVLRAWIILGIILLAVGGARGSEPSEVPVNNAFLTEKGNSFVTVRGGRLDRWQMHTGFHLNSYAAPEDSVILAFPDEHGEAELIGFTAGGIRRWDMLTGRPTGSFEFAGADVPEIRLSVFDKPELLSDYAAATNRLAIADGNVLRVFDPFQGKLLYSHAFEGSVQAVRWLEQGHSLLVSESTDNYKKPRKVTIWHPDSGRLTAVCDGGYATSLAVMPDGSEFTVFQADHFIAYEAGGKALSAAMDYPENVFLTEQKAFYPGAGTYAVFVSAGAVFYADRRSGFRQLSYLGGDRDGYSAGNGQFLFWKGSEVSAAYLDGTVYFRQDLRAGRAALLPAGFSFAADRREVVTERGQSLSAAFPFTQVVESGDRIFTGDFGGWLKSWGASVTPTDSFPVLSTAITHIGPVDGERLFIAGRGRGTVYHTGERKVLCTMRGHQGSVLASLVSADRKFLVTAGQDRAVRLWAVDDGSLLAQRFVPGFPLSMAWSAEGTVQIECVGGSEKWDISAAQRRYLDKGRQVLLSTAHASDVQELSFSADGSTLLSVDDKGVIKTWNPEYLVAFQSIFIDASIRNASFSSDGGEIITHTVNEVYQVDALTGKIKRQVPVPPFLTGNIGIHAIVPIPGSQNILVNNNKNGLQCWIHGGTGEMFQYIFADHPYGVYGMAIDSAGNVLATYGSDGINLWDFREPGKKIRHIAYPNASSSNIYVKRKIGFSPGGTKLYFEDDLDMVVFDLEQDSILLRVARCPALVFLSDHAAAYVSYEEGAGHVLVAEDFRTGEQRYRHPVGNSDQFVNDMAFHAAKGWLALGRSDGHVELRDARNGILLMTTRATNDRVKARFNPNNGHIALTSERRLHIFDWKQLRRLRTLYFPTRGAVTPDFEFTANGRHLLINILGGLQLYDPVSYGQAGALPFADEYAVDPTGRYVGLQVNTYSDRAYTDPDSIYVYDIETRKPVYATKLKSGENSFVWKYVLTPGEQPGILALKTIYDYRDKKKDAQGRYPGKSYLTGYDPAAGGRLDDVELFDESALNLQVSDEGRFLFYEVGWTGIRAFDLTGQKNYLFRPPFSEDLYGPAPEEGKLIVTDEEGTLYLADPLADTILRTFRGHTGEISGFDFYGDYMLSASDDGSVNVWNYQTGDLYCTLRILSRDKYVIFSPDGYYMGSPGLGGAIYFREGDRVYAFDQFDLLYNRPDKVLAAMNGDPALLAALEKAYEKRLRRSGFEPDQLADRRSVPELTIIRNERELLTDRNSCVFRVQGSDAQSALRYIHVWVNGVPVHGSRGLEVSGNRSSLEKELTVWLSEGMNTIEVSVVNAAGIESRKESFRVRYAPEVEAPPARTYYIGVGISDYPGSTHDLKYAVKDIEDLESALRIAYPDLTAILLTDSSASRENILALKDTLLKTRVDDRIIVSFHGHGLLSDQLDFYFAAYGTDFGAPSEGGLAYEAIEWLLDSIPARRKLVLMDACHSGELDKESVVYVEGSNPQEVLEPGVQERSVSGLGRRPRMGVQNSFELMQELFADLSRGNGAVVISAAGGLEYAYEDAKWSNGVFTYSVLRGLQELEADMNGDHAVSVNELKAFVSEEVQRLTRGRQRPTSRQENLEFDFLVW